MNRAIIHLNVADFAVAVERIVDRRLRDRPVIVAPQATSRSVVYDMSEEAYRDGVRKGMPLRQAERRCRDAHLLAPNPYRYHLAMRELLRRAGSYSPLVEPGPGDGHLFVDATGTGRLFGPPVDVAWRLQRRIRADLGLDPIWSVAANKLVAKVATRLVKPSGEYIVETGGEADFLAPLSLGLIPGIERRDRIRLQEFNLTRVHHAAALSLEQLRIIFGRRAGFLHQTVRGVDPSPVRPVGNRPPRVAVVHDFGQDTNRTGVLEGALYRLVERAGSRLRRMQLAAGRIRVVLDHSDGLRRPGRATLHPASTNDLTLFETARRAFLQAWTRRVRVRRLHLTCTRLVYPPAQLPLFAETGRETARRENLVAAVDRIRGRFGADAVRLGRTLAA